MKWTVIYQPSANNELANLWNNAPDKQAVAAASNQIDRELRFDADRKGQPFNDDRILAVSPLAVVFSVSPDDCLVTVLHVFRLDTQ